MLSQAPKTNVNLHDLIRGRKNRMIIFDWDDTILSSTWLLSQGLTTAKNCILQPWHEIELEKLTVEVINNLNISLHFGTVVIVTNAERGWVELSGRKFLPRVLDFILEKNIKIFSARSTYEPKGYKQPVEWKREAFRDGVIEHFGLHGSSKLDFPLINMSPTTDAVTNDAISTSCSSSSAAAAIEDEDAPNPHNTSAAPVKRPSSKSTDDGKCDVDEEDGFCSRSSRNKMFQPERGISSNSDSFSTVEGLEKEKGMDVEEPLTASTMASSSSSTDGDDDNVDDMLVSTPSNSQAASPMPLSEEEIKYMLETDQICKFYSEKDFRRCLFPLQPCYDCPYTVISVGDSAHEREAMIYLNCTDVPVVSKVVKFVERPSLQQLVMAHTTLRVYFADVFDHAGFLDVCVPNTPA